MVIRVRVSRVLRVVRVVTTDPIIFTSILYSNLENLQKTVPLVAAGPLLQHDYQAIEEGRPEGSREEGRLEDIKLMG
jgi:hypothetical protein